MMKSSKGFTLIEMLIAMSIGMVVMVGTVQLFKSNHEIFKLMDQMKLMEENGRIGMDLMAREVRAAFTGDGGRPIYVWDNDPANNDPAQTEGAIDWVALDVLPGTDVLEVFTSLCSEAIQIPAFNENTAATPLMNMDVVASCLPCYNSGDGTGTLANCGSSFNIRIHQVGTDYSCQHNITQGNEQGATDVNLVWNNGVNNDNANRPHQCDDGVGGPPTWDAVAYIGTDIYYYVRADDPDNPNPAIPNPQLIRYQVGMNPEVVANYVEDFQILVGEDNSAPADGTIDRWGDGIVTGLDVKAVKLTLMLRSPDVDRNKTAAVPTFIDNSAIASTGVADKYRRRVLTRAVRLRAAAN